MITAAAKLLYEMEYERDTVLVVITERADSAPRGTGSFMLIGSAGHLFGTIGGGAVEKRSEELAAECLAEKKSAVHVFPLKPNRTENIGMICGGDVTVFFQYISGTDEVWHKTAETIIGMYHSRRDGYLLLDMNGGAPKVADDAGSIVSGGGTAIKVPDIKMSCTLEGSFLLHFNTGERVLIFGAGHCGRALAPILNSVGFRVTVFDNRPDFADPILYTFAEQVICGDYERISDYIELTEEDYIVIMTSGHYFDFVVEKQALAAKRAYVGVIGSSKKIAAVNKRLTDAGISPDILKEVYTPIGLPIKAVTPEEIAVSIAGEMIRVRANKREGIAEHPPADKKVH